MAGTIAFDAYSADDANVNVDASFTHTPVSGSPRAALVFLAMTATASDGVVGAAYGGNAMTEVSGSPRIHSAGADDSVLHAFLLDNIPSGPQTVTVDITAATTYRTGCVTVTTNGGAVEVDTTAGNDSGAGTGSGGTVTLATTASRDTVCIFLFHTGEAGVASVSTDGTNMGEYDYGNQTCSHDRKDGAGGNVACTVTVSADTFHGFGIALGSQDPPGGGATNPGWNRGWWFRNEEWARNNRIPLLGDVPLLEAA